MCRPHPLHRGVCCLPGAWGLGGGCEEEASCPGKVLRLFSIMNFSSRQKFVGFDHVSVYTTPQACCQMMGDTHLEEGERIFEQALAGLIDRALKEGKGVKSDSLEINLGTACQCLWNKLLARSFSLLSVLLKLFSYINDEYNSRCTHFLSTERSACMTMEL